MTPPSRTGAFTVEMAFNQYLAGHFYIDVSRIGGTDGLYDTLTAPFIGTFDDVTDYVHGPVAVAFGTDQLLGAVQSSTCDFVLKDALDVAHWNPANAASAPNRNVPGFREMRPVRVRQTDPDTGTVYSIYYGYLADAQYSSQTWECNVHCEDLLMYLGRVSPVLPSLGATTTGAAIGRILDAVGFSDPAYRNLSTGDSIPDFWADGTQTALAMIVALVQAELGTVWVNGAGVFQFADRTVAQVAAVSYAFTTEPLNISAGLDVNNLFNTYTVTRDGGLAQTAIDTASQSRYGVGVGPAVSSPYIPDDATALAIAGDLLYGSRDQPMPIVLTIDNATGPLFVEQQTLELLNAVTINEPTTKTVGTYSIMRKTHTIDVQGAYMTTQYLLRQRSNTAANWRIDISQLDGTDVLRY